MARKESYYYSTGASDDKPPKKPGPVEIIVIGSLVALATILLAYICVTSYNVAQTKYYVGRKTYERADKKSQINDLIEKSNNKEKGKSKEDKQEDIEKSNELYNGEGLKELKLEDVENNSSYSNSNYINTTPKYKGIQNYEYSYYYVVPDHFVQVNNDYYSPDNTAKMNIYAAVNDRGITSTDALNTFISSVGGKVTYSAKGSDWFAVSVEKDGIVYYRKGFTDHYIREFTFIHPEAYVDVYDDYINVIEDNFKRTDK